MNDTKIQIHYWSSTGNTKLAAELAAESLSETGAKVTVTDIRRMTANLTNDACENNGALQKSGALQKNNQSPDKTYTIDECDLWVVAMPIHAFKMALAFQEFLTNVKLCKGQKVAAIFTCAGFEDRAPLKLSKILVKKGASPWDWQTLICEDSWPVARNYLPMICSWDEPSTKKRELFKAWWRAVPGRLSDNCPGRSFWRIPTPLTPLSFVFRKSLIKHTFPLYIDMNKCTKCRACELQCPTGRISVDNFPESSGDCLACYGCINVCREDAIDTWFTKGAKRYRGPER
jgi:NAD-dependent dihydropyrimidine dehydrogenase PreA subunit/menaquinone-dependent protoporphyrinogen IX oxidase